MNELKTLAARRCTRLVDKLQKKFLDKINYKHRIWTSEEIRNAFHQSLTSSLIEILEEEENLSLKD